MRYHRRMKKLPFLLILFVAGTAYAGYYFIPDRMPPFMHPEGRACSRMTSLCGEAAKDCDQAFAELRKASGPESIRKPIKCIMSAQSCPESAGCMAGGGVNAVIKSGEEFLKGLRNSVGE